MAMKKNIQVFKAAQLCHFWNDIIGLISQQLEFLIIGFTSEKWRKTNEHNSEFSKTNLIIFLNEELSSQNMWITHSVTNINLKK